MTWRIPGRTAASLAAAVALLAAAAPCASAAAPLQPVLDGFRDEPVMEGLESPMAVRFAPPPDGRVLVAEKSGRVRVYRGVDDPAPALAVDLSEEVHDFWDRGLLGMALDPGFAVNGRLYVLYTRDAPIGGAPPRWADSCPDPPGATTAGCVVSGALARITVDALGVATEVETLIQDEWCQQFPSHSVGTVAFGPDGMLYAGAGDGASFMEPDWGQLPGVDGFPANPCGDPPWEGGSMRSQDVRTPADPTGLSGAILRVDPATGDGEPGNPFSGGDAGARRLIAYGLRNPFRFAFRPGTPEIWLGDVGMGRWEEIDVIPDATDAVAENFGWPCFEGDGSQDGWDVVPGCQALPAAAVTPPVFRYEHRRDVVPGDGCSFGRGASISGIAFPPAYRGQHAGSLFFADYTGGCVFELRAGEDGRPDPGTVGLFARAGGGAVGPIELQAGPGGDLYYTTFDPEHPAAGSVHRIRQLSADAAPAPVPEASPAAGEPPLTVTFSVADPDAGVRYDWDLDGDGEHDDATGEPASWTYTEPGTVRASVRATDGDGRTGDGRVTVTVGNTPPRPAIEAPADTLQWAAGEEIAFRGSAQDDQETLAPDALSWVITLDHCPQEAGDCHAHPLQRAAGPSGTFAAPDHGHPSRLVLTLVAKDSGGLTGSATVRLEQRAPGAAAAPAGAPAAAGAPAPPAARPGRTAAFRLRVRRGPPRALAPRLSVLVRCTRACRVGARATLRAGRAARRLPPPRSRARQGGARLELRLPARARRVARRALRRGARARVDLVLTARDGSGRRRRATARVPLRLP